MEHKNYFPTAIAEQRAWFVNYKPTIAIHGAAVGLSAAQIAAEQAICQTAIDEIDATDAMLTAATAKVAERNALIKTQMGVFRPAISGFKTKSGFTVAIGQALDIIGAEIIIDTMTVKTVVKLAKVPLGVDIKFGLEHCQGGNIYSKRATETVFTFLKYVTHPHTIDTRPNLADAIIEQRQYYVTLVINDLEVGIPSAPETINN